MYSYVILIGIAHIIEIIISNKALKEQITVRIQHFNTIINNNNYNKTIFNLKRVIVFLPYNIDTIHTKICVWSIIYFKLWDFLTNNFNSYLHTRVSRVESKKNYWSTKRSIRKINFRKCFNIVFSYQYIFFFYTINKATIVDENHKFVLKKFLTWYRWRVY